MIKKRFTLSQDGTFHTVRDNVENKPLGVFEFKDDEFPVYACFHEIIDLLNQLNNENACYPLNIKENNTISRECRKELRRLRSKVRN